MPLPFKKAAVRITLSNELKPGNRYESLLFGRVYRVLSVTEDQCQVVCESPGSITTPTTWPVATITDPSMFDLLPPETSR